MCGRFVSSTPPDQLAAYFSAVPTEAALAPSWNVAPTNDIYGVVEHGGERRLTVFHWGLVPVWAKDIKIGSKMINARAETLAEKNSFKTALKKRRCLIPLDGFYEWKSIPGVKTKQPMFIHRVDGEPLAVAGLWESWKDRSQLDANGEPMVLHSATIITTSANETMRPVHDRMPAILSPATWSQWLDTSNDDMVSLGELLVPAPNTLLTMHPVSTSVNNVRTKGPELIDEVPPIEPPGEQAALL
ncbi:MAG: SOS response-associated peptidase [Acidimicrobiia bacterium]